MKTEIIHISKEIHLENVFQSEISFRKFVDFILAGIKDGPSIKVPYFKWIVKKFKKHPELYRAVPIEKLAGYAEILELVSTSLLPLASDETSLWALSAPLAPEIFYSTDGFQSLMESLKRPVVLNPLTETAESESGRILQELQYGMVLEKIYKLPYLKKTEWIRKFEDPDTGLDKYFEVHIDTRFIDIRMAGHLPEMDCSALSPSSVWGEEFEKIKEKIPLNQFVASGFSVVRLRDVTAEQAVKQVAKLVIHDVQTDKRPMFEEVTHSLQTIVGSREYQFGIVPFLEINDRPALIYENYPFSVIIPACWNYEISKKEFTKLRNEFAENPRNILWSSKDKESKMPEILAEALRHAGINTYAMFPVYHNQKITGIFEVASRNDTPMLNEAQLVRLKAVLPLTTQLIQDIFARFNRSIENIIKEKFTSIQPAVQWKFNETAWHYLRDHGMEHNNDSLENIVFKDLHPLYGAVDIRNSTILRNQVLEKDYTVQLRILIQTLSALGHSSRPELETILMNANNWLQIIHEPMTTQQEIRLSEFFDLEVQNELENLIHAEPETEEILIPYFQSIDEQNGISYENRRQLELAIRALNSVVNNFYETAALELQQIFPCYFEKFRTDGVEYDIYVGQSISPKLKFQKEHLLLIKRWQLESMIKVIHLVHDLAPEMAIPLQTTQLLFVHPQTIDITFRKDERRFDVEGAYNIRYHIIKKRIDKVLIFGTNERLTQPDKIALIYFDERDAIEFKALIKPLQEENLLMNDLEALELESLQGVDGLKALRVGVRKPDLRERIIPEAEFEKTN